jgi:hypothetical protein
MVMAQENALLKEYTIINRIKGFTKAIRIPIKSMIVE